MQIRLQSCAGPFDSEFIDSLGDLESAMIRIGLDPNDFTVSKTFAPFSDRGPLDADPLACEYTVFAGREHFTITQTDDLHFLTFFWQLCLSAKPHDSASAVTPANVMTKFAGR
jgi:hypothetical protein